MAHRTYDEYWQARNVPKDLDDVTHPVLIVAGWFDARISTGRSGCTGRSKEKNPGNKTHARRRAVAARRLGARRRRRARQHHVRLEDRRVLPQRDRAAVLQLLPEGQGPARSCREAIDRSRPAATAGGRYDAVAAEARRERRATLYLPAPRRRPVVHPPPRTAPRDRVRRVRQRSAQARAVHRRDHDDEGHVVHGRGSALRRRAARRARLPDRAADRGPRRSPGPIEVDHARRHDRHRRRLGGEADRRLSRRRARSGAEPAERADGRLPDAAGRRHPARQVPQQHSRRPSRWCRTSRRSCSSRWATGTTRS